ncbi:MAG: hypothetical protein KA126_05435 [Candidatus Hydrothermae bacterium]|nr:hypothetical protein [Candidatus Hydrothermae bacterium]MDD5572835.1 hypothetical protein [Candidatus Hydrothermia bacterium]HOK22805.1 hypothetical protein [Candidatus Hydrothermia bacterium]HOL23514.1 hypothetical protein [Candidatus Hydrothermia bacterium]HPO78521.1 hypothetical protein [Candidatus Hydrothermia bacterium]
MEILALILVVLLPTGDHFFMERDYFNAITEYKRALFRGDADSSIILRKIALSYLEQQKYDYSMKYYSEYLYNYDAEVSRLYAVALIRSGLYDDAIYLLSGTEDLCGLELIAIAHGFAGRYDSSFAILDSLNIAHPDYVDDEKALLFSRILPGFGLVFIGEVPLFLGTLAITGACGYLTYRYVRRGLYFEALTTGFPLFQRFYRGGLSNMKLKYRIYYENTLKRILSELESSLIEREEARLFDF